MSSGDKSATDKRSGEARQTDGEGLRRNLRPRHMQMIALGGIIGTSLFVGSGQVIHTVGPAAVLSYALGGLLVFLVMRMLGEMAVARPALGSFMEYSRLALGDWAGFAVGWLYWYFWVGVVAYEAVVGADLIAGFLPMIPKWITSFGLLILLTITNLISVRSFGETEFWLASVKVVTILVFVVVGVLFVVGLMPGSTFSVPNIAKDGFVATGWTTVFQGVVVVIFSYFGTEIVTIVAAESEEPERAVAKATVATAWRVVLFYVGSIALIVMITPWDQVPFQPDQGGPFAAAFDRFGLPAAGTVMKVVVFTAVLSVLNSGLYTASRMLFALRSHNWAPRWVGDTSRQGVPWKGILLSTVLAYVAVATNYVTPEGFVFTFIQNSGGAIALFVYLLIGISQIRMRNRLERDQPDGLKLKMWFHPWLALVSLAGIGLVLIAMAIIEDSRPQFLASLVSVATILIAYAVVAWRRRASGGPGDGKAIVADQA